MKMVRSVLIVDDNPADVEIAEYYLSNSGCFGTVLRASDGQEALELFKNYEASRREHPDDFPPVIMLVDINMPRMNGFEFVRAYDALPEKGDGDIPIVILTSSSYEKDIEEATSNNLVRRYLTKPFTSSYAQELASAFGD